MTSSCLHALTSAGLRWHRSTICACNRTSSTVITCKQVKIELLIGSGRQCLSIFHLCQIWHLACFQYEPCTGQALSINL
ncbi:hypothetical protein AAHA92_20406 [Salvia divinorum]|uniref:Uncharacterized protein n=1 Tax=Salvia divinorum TaxID=28513 RepID=A0ABD1GH35_SALDI